MSSKANTGIGIWTEILDDSLVAENKWMNVILQYLQACSSFLSILSCNKKKDHI